MLLCLPLISYIYPSIHPVVRRSSDALHESSTFLPVVCQLTREIIFCMMSREKWKSVAKTEKWERLKDNNIGKQSWKMQRLQPNVLREEKSEILFSWYYWSLVPYWTAFDLSRKVYIVTFDHGFTKSRARTNRALK